MSDGQESKHTPGPWGVDKVQEEWELTLNIADPTGRHIAEVSYACLEAEANAHLIAAAPGLLDSHYEIANYPHIEDCEGWCPVEVARAAIAKTKGEQ